MPQSAAASFFPPKAKAAEKVARPKGNCYKETMNRRGSGLLLHVTSLPSPYGIGDLGPEAYRFADFLAETGQSFWQVLPLNPTGYGNSPYSSPSAFAGNTLLISPDLLVAEGLLTAEEVESRPSFPEGRCDYGAVIPFKERLFETAYERFKARPDRHGYEEFCEHSESWLAGYAQFVALKGLFSGKSWNEWPEAVRDRKPEILKTLGGECWDGVEKARFLQYLFFKQWLSLKDYCNARGIRIMGDIPIYVSFDSADAWENSHMFKLDEGKRPTFVAGVPPDYFSATGQLWGNPVYNWEVLKEQRYAWWTQRIGHVLTLYDVVRIDHFRGLVAYWEVPAGEATAMNGRWVEAPADDLFGALLRRFPRLPLVAEDLGVITADVREVMARYDLPGMKVLLFAFGEDNPMQIYLPHVYERNSVVYTGTHDNNTARGWFDDEAGQDVKERLFRYIGRMVSSDEAPLELIRLAMMSVADTAIVPIQDLLGLGSTARMNRPSMAEGNWEWRLVPGQLTDQAKGRLEEMTRIYGRK